MNALIGEASVLERIEIRDDVLTVRGVGHAEEHAGAVHDTVWVLQELVQGGVVPGDPGVLHPGRELESRYRAALTADDTGKGRPDLVHAGSCGMAASTAAEHVLASLRIAGSLGHGYAQRHSQKCGADRGSSDSE